VSLEFAGERLLLSPASYAGCDQGTGGRIDIFFATDFSAAPDQLRLTLTHEEIGEMIGTSRETVSRLFSDFKKRQIVQLKGSVLIIRNRPALQKMIQS